VNVLLGVNVQVPPVVAEITEAGDTPILVLPLSAGLMLIVGVRLVSLIVIVDPAVATITPLVLTRRTDTVNVSAPSVVKSALVVTVNVPELPTTLNDPLSGLKSALVVTV
jgi:hypothetical protein